MIVKVLFFAAAKDIAGTASLDFVLPDDATVGQLQQNLVEQFPGLLHVVGQSAVSVDQVFVSAEKLLYHGAEIAILPPASGG